jgi:hypothetical protein
MSDLEELLDDSSGDPRFYDILFEMAKMHKSKSHDYGLNDTEEFPDEFFESDPLFNFRGAPLWGVEPWIGALVRAQDKASRLQTHAHGHQLENESVRDTILDWMSYLAIALILYEEEYGNPEESTEEEDI